MNVDDVWLTQTDDTLPQEKRCVEFRLFEFIEKNEEVIIIAIKWMRFVFSSEEKKIVYLVHEHSFILCESK